jgi:hypothetical protein
VFQIIKDELFDASDKIYIPRFLKASTDSNLSSVIDFMEDNDSRSTLEIWLQPYQSANEQKRWMQAIRNMNEKLKSLNSNRLSIDNHLADYDKYYSCQTTPPTIFRYSIKAYGEKQGYIQPLLIALRNIALSQDSTNDCRVESLSSPSGALVKVGSFAIERSEWQNHSLVKVPIKQESKPIKQGWATDGDGSLDIDNLFAPGINLQQIINAHQNNQALPQIGSQSQGQLTPSQGGQIAHTQSNQKPQPISIEDMKPLHQLVCFEEIQGFLNLGVSTKGGANFPDMFTIHALINKFGHLITEDTYVAGIDRDGNPCISDFSKLAHRLVGGMNGTGKTNYILSVVYQFLHANPDREVFMIDFQAGLHYEYTIKKRKNVQMVTTFEDCDKLLKKMLEKHFERRAEMTTYEVRGRKELLDAGIKQNAVLLIIDEAFYIKNAERDFKKSIESNLNTLAAQARVTGIHILYSTQTPTSDVIDPQTLNNIGERVLFAIESAADSRRIIGTDEAYELPLIPKGRALFKGSDRLPVQIATPLVPDEVW